MTKNEVDEIGRALGFKLPPEYQTVLVNYPYPGALCSKLDLFSDKDTILEKNIQLRSGEYYGYDWPTDFIAIGIDGNGNVWFVRAFDSSCQVYYGECDEEFPPADPVYSLDEFVERLGRENPWDDGPLPILGCEFGEENIP